MIPAIDSERLTLRGHTVADFGESLAMWTDLEVVRHIGGRPMTEEEVWIRLLRHVGHWELLGHGLWVVREAATGRFVGEVGFLELHRDIQPRMDGPEAGWVLAPSAHGKGYATEAMTAALAWGATRFGAQHTLCMIDPDNTASLRVAAKIGYREVHRTTYKTSPAIIFARPGGV